jgi:DNA-binding NtrC family response regulator
VAQVRIVTGDWQIAALFLQHAAKVHEPDAPSIAGAAVRRPVDAVMGAGIGAAAVAGADAGVAGAGSAAASTPEPSAAEAGGVPAADAADAARTPVVRAAVARRFRPIDDEIRELERTRMIEALAATGGVQNRAAALIHMPLRTFVTKLKRYLITPADWSDDR